MQIEKKNIPGLNNILRPETARRGITQAQAKTTFTSSPFSLMPLLILPFISALLLFLASPVPGFVPLAWISLIPLFFFVQNSSPRAAFFSGWLAGVAYYLAMLYWVTISMETYGGLAPWLSTSGLVLLSAYMGIYHGFFCFSAAFVLRKKVIFPIWFMACIWVGLDYLRGVLFTGLPWMDVGYFHYQSPVSQLADLGGHHLLTFLTLLVNGVLYQFWQNKSLKPVDKPVWLAIICIILAMTYSPLRLAQINTAIKQAPLLQTGVIQANIDQAVKWQKDNKLASVNRHIALTNAALSSETPPKLILWPETSLPFYPTFDPAFYNVQAETVLRDGADFELLCGAPHIIRRPGKGYDLYNAALLMRPDKTTDFYHKQHLVPFGEYIPLRGILPFPKAIVESIGDFSPGKDSAILQSARAKIGVLICIEAIYPDLARKEVAQGAELLANITNDAWFGRSSAPLQHLAMSIMRAIENRRSLARSANTGISALVSPTGEILAASELFTEEHLSAPLPILNQRTIFNRFGFLFPLLCLGYAIILLFRLGRAKAIDD